MSGDTIIHCAVVSSDRKSSAFVDQSLLAVNRGSAIRLQGADASIMALGRRVVLTVADQTSASRWRHSKFPMGRPLEQATKLNQRA